MLSIQIDYLKAAQQCVLYPLLLHIYLYIYFKIYWLKWHMLVYHMIHLDLMFDIDNLMVWYSMRGKYASLMRRRWVVIEETVNLCNGSHSVYTRLLPIFLPLLLAIQIITHISFSSKNFFHFIYEMSM